MKAVINELKEVDKNSPRCQELIRVITANFDEFKEVSPPLSNEKDIHHQPGSSEFPTAYTKKQKDDAFKGYTFKRKTVYFSQMTFICLRFKFFCYVVVLQDVVKSTLSSVTFIDPNANKPSVPVQSTNTTQEHQATSSNNSNRSGELSSNGSLSLSSSSSSNNKVVTFPSVLLDSEVLGSNMNSPADKLKSSAPSGTIRALKELNSLSSFGSLCVSDNETDAEGSNSRCCR
jgi:hypothetical protein